MARGDQIYVYREWLNLEGIYEHHGIDCGDGSVIHYSKRSPTPKVQRMSVELFAQGKPIYVQRYPSSFIADTAIYRAESRLGEQKYNLLFNNCEHFATWCKTGFSKSQQIENFVPAIAQLKTEEWYEPIHHAIQDTGKHNARQLLHQALADIKVVWDDVQPRYTHAIAEAQTWQQVAAQALKNNREDLARAALVRKHQYQKQARELEAQLQQLATMTENLVRNSQNL